MNFCYKTENLSQTDNDFIISLHIFLSLVITMLNYSFYNIYDLVNNVQLTKSLICSTCAI